MSGDNEDEPPAYAVGYRKPPLHGRIKPGEVRNPRGRRKGARNLKDELKEVLDEPIVVKIGGEPKRISTRKALIKSLAHAGIKGNHIAASKALALDAQLLSGDAPETDMKALSDVDRAIIEDLIKRKSK